MPSEQVIRWAVDRTVSRKVPLYSIFFPFRRSKVSSMSSTSGKPSGTSLGRYSLIRLIKTGGMGAVYEARDQSSDAEIAVSSPSCLL